MGKSKQEVSVNDNNRKKTYENNTSERSADLTILMVVLDATCNHSLDIHLIRMHFDFILPDWGSCSGFNLIWSLLQGNVWLLNVMYGYLV